MESYYNNWFEELLFFYDFFLEGENDFISEF